MTGDGSSSSNAGEDEARAAGSSTAIEDAAPARKSGSVRFSRVNRALYASADSALIGSLSQEALDGSSGEKSLSPKGELAARRASRGSLLSPRGSSFANVVAEAAGEDAVKRWSMASPRGSARGSFLAISTPRGSLPLSAQLAANASQTRRRPSQYGQAALTQRSSRASASGGRAGSPIEIVLGAGGLDNLPRTPKRSSKRASTICMSAIARSSSRGSDRSGGSRPASRGNSRPASPGIGGSASRGNSRPPSRGAGNQLSPTQIGRPPESLGEDDSKSRPAAIESLAPQSQAAASAGAELSAIQGTEEASLTDSTLALSLSLPEQDAEQKEPASADAAALLRGLGSGDDLSFVDEPPGTAVDEEADSEEPPLNRGISFQDSDESPCTPQRNNKFRKTIGKIMFMTTFKLARQRSLERSHLLHGSAHWENNLGERTIISEELSALPMFASCKQAFVQELARNIEAVKVAEGSEILQDTSQGPAMLLVLRGSVQVYMEDVPVVNLSQGQYFGEACLLGLEEEWGAQLVSTAASTVSAVRRHQLLKALSFFPQERRYFEGIFEKNKMNMSEGTLINVCAVFRGLSANTILKIDSLMLRRIYFPGEKILEEGTRGDELYIMVRGKATVEIAGRSVREERRDSQAITACGTELNGQVMGRKSIAQQLALAKGRESTAEENQRVGKGDENKTSDDGDGSGTSDDESKSSDSDEEPAAEQHDEDDKPVCFGELGLLGMQETRSATIVAQGVCHMRVLHRTNFLNTLQSNNESLQMEQMRGLWNRYQDRKTKAPKKVLREVKIFKDVGCSENFLDFLAQHLEDRIFLNGQKIIDEKESEDRCMYLLAQGSVTVLKGGEEVATLKSGAVFGEIIVLGLASKRSATVVAAETCYMQVLHQSVVIRGLELFPDERSKVLMMAFNSASMEKAETGKAERPPSVAGGEPSDLVHHKSETPQLAGQSSTNRAFLKALKQSPLFENMSPKFVEELSHVSQDRIYMPGDLIIEEGKRGDSMFIMVSGTATVFVSDPDNVTTSEQRPEPDAPEVTVNGERLGKSLMITENTKTFKKKSMSRIGVLTAGSISGELAMLGVSTIRSATIEASTICSMWEITQEKALSILECFPDAQRHFADIIVSHLERTVPARILSLPLFRGFDRKFRMLLGLYCERTAFFPGQVIAGEGKPGDRLFIVNQGRATLEKKGVTVKTYAAGSHFGSTVMLGVHKVYLGSLVALQTCHVLIVLRTSYQQALEQYPSLVASQELKRSEKAAVEELREAIQRISTRKLIWKRYQFQLLDTQDPDAKKLTNKELLERALQSWSSHVKALMRHRRQRETERKQYQRMMEDWVQKKRSAWERVQMKKAAEQEGGWPILSSDGSRLKAKDEKRRPNTVHGPSPGRRPSAMHGPSPGKVELAGVLQDWPAPRPSPHYRLRVFGVLYEAATRPSSGAPVLPLLTSRGAQGTANKDEDRGENVQGSGDAAAKSDTKSAREREEAATQASNNSVTSGAKSARKSDKPRGVRLSFPEETEYENGAGGHATADTQSSCAKEESKARKSEEYAKRNTLRSSDLQAERNKRLARDKALLHASRKASNKLSNSSDEEDEDDREGYLERPREAATLTNAGRHGCVAEADPVNDDLGAADSGQQSPLLGLRGAAPRSIDESLLVGIAPLSSAPSGGGEAPVSARGSQLLPSKAGVGSISSSAEAGVVLPKLEVTPRR